MGRGGEGDRSEGGEVLRAGGGVAGVSPGERRGWGKAGVCSPERAATGSFFFVKQQK